MKTAAICLVTFFLIASPLAALSQDEQSLRRLDELDEQSLRRLIEIPEVYPANDDDDDELKIKKEIVRTIQEEMGPKQNRVDEGQQPVSILLTTYQRMQAAKEAVHANNKAELIKVASDVLNRALATEKNRVLRANNGVGRPDDAAMAKAFRLQCELRLLQLDRTEYVKYKQEKLPAALSKIKQLDIPEVYQPSDDDDDELKIKKEIVRTIYWELESKQKRFAVGAMAGSFLLKTYQRMQAAKEAVNANNKVELIKVARDMLNKAWVVEEDRVFRWNKGVGRPDDAAEAKAFRLQCELRLLQLDRTEYENYKQQRSQLSKYIRGMIETAKSSELFSNFKKHEILGPTVTKNPGEDFEMQTRIRIDDDSGLRKFGHIFFKAKFDNSEFHTQEFYLELEGKRTNFSVGNQ